ncbi:MAG: hypothetical protein IAF58_14665 [Leptolyngbya sp.]|nr:hypothetical protein [Candidatus Melainabacteria bacterium]
MNTQDKPANETSTGKASFERIVSEIVSSLTADDLTVFLTGEKTIKVGTLNGETVSFCIQGASPALSCHGHAVLTFSYGRETDIQAALAPDLSIGNRYHPARLAKRTGEPVPTEFNLAASALQQSYFRVVTDEENLPAEVVDCRLLFARGNWHPGVHSLTQGIVADLKWVPAE